MEKKESAIHKIGRQALDTAIRHEIDGWPPYSIMGIYQPHRPELIRILSNHRRKTISDSLYFLPLFTYYPRHIKQL